MPAKRFTLGKKEIDIEKMPLHKQQAIRQILNKASQMRHSRISKRIVDEYLKQNLLRIL